MFLMISNRNLIINAHYVPGMKFGSIGCFPPLCIDVFDRLRIPKFVPNHLSVHFGLLQLHSLSFFVLDEADRMIENGHFHELQSIIDMLPATPGTVEGCGQVSLNFETISSLQWKKRQTFVFSATIALSAGFRKKLKRGSHKPKTSMNDDMSSIETLSERAGMKADAAIVDLTNASIMAHKLEESFIEYALSFISGFYFIETFSVSMFIVSIVIADEI